MAILKNFPLRLNQDDDVRRLTPADMTDALNLQTSKSSGNNEGVAENVRGNELIANAELPTGTNKVIGTIEHLQSNNLFYFVWNSNDEHCIFYVNDITKNIRLVLKSSVLNFNKNGFVVGEALQGRDSSEILLYFTDNFNQPRKVNVKKALQNDYATITDEIISIVKYQPNAVPTWTYNRDASVVFNNVYNKHFVFRYRYIYDDGETSAYSATSSLTYNDEQLLSSLKDSADPYNDLNNIRIIVTNGSEIVDKIEIIAREGDLGEWRIIGSINNNSANDTVAFDFKNDGAYPVADPIETNKYFDNVPLQAESLALVNSRLFMGNYVDGYDKNESIANIQDGDTDITLNYRSTNFDIPTFTQTTFNNNILSGGTVYITQSVFNDFIGNFSAGDLFILNEYVSFGINGAADRVTPTIFESYTAQVGDDINDVLTGLLLSIPTELELGNGLTREVSQLGSILTIKYTITDAPRTFSGSVNRVSNNGKYDALSAAKSFKKGSKYSLGIIEFDEAGRASTMNTFVNNDIYIPTIAETTPNTKDMLGAISIDYRLGTDIQPSLRTRKWCWGITENTSIGNFTQYSATGAYPSANALYPNDGTVYVSLRGLQSQPSSYNQYFGTTDVEYNFEEGDRLRIISYIDNTNTRVITQGDLNFRVTSGRIYGEDDSPIINGSDLTEKTGYIIGLQPISEDGWDSSSTSYWNKSTTDSLTNEGSVIFEIYRPRPQTEDEQKIYYEIGGLINVPNAGTSTRTFAGNIRSQGDNESKSVSAQTTNSVTLSTPTNTFVIGDTIECKTGLGIVIARGRITDIQDVSGDTVVYIDFSLSTLATISTIELDDKPAAGTLTDGDVWVRPRLIRNDNFVNAQSFIVFPVEDYAVSDFYSSRAWGKGRPNAFSEEAKEFRRFSTITYSENYFNETTVNGLSSFNLGLANFKQYTQSYGAIRRLYSNDVYLACFQENKIGRIPISRQIIQTADGGTSLTLSNSVLNDIDYYKGDYGLSKSESFVAYDGDFFGWDIKRAKVWELNASGLQLVSDNKMSSFFETQSKTLLPFYKTTRIPLGLDREFDMVYVSSVTEAVTESLSDGTNIALELFPDIDENSGKMFFKANPEKTSKRTGWSVLTETRNASQIFEPLSQLGGARQNLNLLPENGAFEYNGDIRTSGTETVYYNINFAGTQRVAVGEYDFSTGLIGIDTAQAGYTLTKASGSAYSGFTLGYDKNYNSWVSFYSFLPEMYGSINYSTYSFKDGEIYKHNETDTYNSFYGFNYATIFEVNFNQEPSRVKLFNSASIEGNKGDFIVEYSTNLNATASPSGYFTEKEGFFQAMIPRTTTQSSFSSVLGGGNGTIAGTTLTIDDFNAYDVGIQVGDELYNSSGTLQGTVVEVVTASTFTLTAGSGTSFFYFSRPSETIEGDRLRGYYLTAKFTRNADNTFTEVFSVSTDATNSKLHNT